jgi:hypothetical protein
MTMKRRGALIVALGLALTGGLFGFAVNPAQALSISGTYTDIAFGTPGTETNVIGGLQTGLVGAIGAPLVGGFPNVAAGLGTNYWSTATPGVTADAIGTRVDNASGLTLPAGFATNFFPSGQSANGPGAGYLAVHWTATFSSPAPVTFNLAADDHAFLYIDGVLFLDDGGVKAVTDPQAGSKVFAGAGNHTLDLFFADVQTIQSGIIFSCDGCADPVGSEVPEPATLVLFGTTLVGLGSVVRRRMKATKQAA